MSKHALPVSVAALFAVACQHTQAPPVMVGRPPSVPQQQISTPATVVETKQGTPQLLETRVDTSEERVQIETHGREVDVREILNFLGQRAGVHFVYAPEINKKIRLSINDVPLSQAIALVFSLANLTLEGSTGPGQKPLATSVVFYELPVNVDSLSVDAIMKRFGVGRSVAEMLVEARTKRP